MKKPKFPFAILLMVLLMFGALFAINAMTSRNVVPVESEEHAHGQGR